MGSILCHHPHLFLVHLKQLCYSSTIYGYFQFSILNNPCFSQYFLNSNFLNLSYSPLTPLFLNLAVSQVGYQYQGGQAQHTSEQQHLQQGKEREGQFTQGLGWEHFYSSSNGPSS